MLPESENRFAPRFSLESVPALMESPHASGKPTFPTSGRPGALDKRIKSIFNPSTIAIQFNYSCVFSVRLPADAAMSVDLVASEIGLDAVQDRLAIDGVYRSLELCLQRKFVLGVRHCEFRRRC